MLVTKEVPNYWDLRKLPMGGSKIKKIAPKVYWLQITTPNLYHELLLEFPIGFAI
jgi:hypothetical protein